ncbi:MAG: hypothetical protein HY826_00465 [Actinobacteria bacterium]|nr:hypothetical protein [Actinomycetota bacterium]
MQSFVLLAVAAVWLAVIVPPLLRSRVENRPNASVTDFRRQLSTLQRTVPTRTMVPMHGMARQLAQPPVQQRSSHQRSHTMHGHPGEARRSAVLEATHERESMSRRPGGQRMHEGSLQRRHGGDDTTGHRTMHLHKVSQRELVRRRRSNILFVLVVTVGISAFLAATTHNGLMIYTFALSFVSLCGFCYKLVQLRSYGTDRTYGQQSWFNAA